MRVSRISRCILLSCILWIACARCICAADPTAPGLPPVPTPPGGVPVTPPVSPAPDKIGPPPTLAPAKKLEPSAATVTPAPSSAPVIEVQVEDTPPVLVPPPPPKDLVDTTEKDEIASQHRKDLNERIKVQLLEAKKAYKQKDYQRVASIAHAIIAADPRNVAAAEWLRLANGKMADADTEVAEVGAERRDREAILEAEEHTVRPPPRIPEQRPFRPKYLNENETVRRKKMNEKLDQRVTVDFMKADLEWVLNTLFILTGVNIIADQAALEGKSLTLHVEDLPLREVLNFIVRNNDGIQYSITEDAVWITASEAGDLKKVMYVRVYPLQHGLMSTAEGNGGNSGGRGAGGNRGGGGGSRGGGGGGAGGRGGGKNAQGGKQSGQQQEATYLETVLKWMKDVKDPLVFPDGSDYMVDRESSQLIVYTTSSGHDRISDMLEQFDQPGIQVLIKTRFLSIESENEKSVGVNLDKLTTNLGTITAGTGTTGTGTTGTGTGTTGTGTGTSGTGTTTNTRNPFHTFNYTGGTQPINIPGNLGNGNVFSLVGVRTNPQFQLTVAALLNNRLTKILSEPQILAVNNKQAIIDVSTHFSYITDLRPVESTNFGGNGTATNSVSAFVPEFDTEEVGFTLIVTPSVGYNLKTINLHLSPIVDTLAQGQQITQFQQFDVTQVNNTGTPPVIQRPTIDQTSFETDVILEDNGYVIIGGLLRNQNEVRERKVPGLYKIPYLGNLFKATSKNSTKSNLMIIVEAQIITPRGRTYYREPAIDDVDLREGGVIRAPGQTSDAYFPGESSTPRPVIHDDDSSTPDSNYRARPGSPGNKGLANSGAAQPGMRSMNARERMERAARASRQQANTETPEWSLAQEDHVGDTHIVSPQPKGLDSTAPALPPVLPKQ